MDNNIFALRDLISLVRIVFVLAIFILGIVLFRDGEIPWKHASTFPFTVGYVHWSVHS